MVPRSGIAAIKAGRQNSDKAGVNRPGLLAGPALWRSSGYKKRLSETQKVLKYNL